VKENKKVWGHGILDKGVYPAYTGKLTPEYVRWTNMLQRCYSPNYHIKQKNYKGCKVDEEWLYFQNFAEWCNKQPNWGKPRYALDKDLTVIGNNIYSPEMCYIIPPQLNSALTFPIVMCEGKGELPIGVFYNEWNKCYEARCGNGRGGSTHLRQSQDVWECFKSYAEYKKEKLIEVANRYKDEISETIYNNLINYEVIPYPTKSSYQPTNPIL
jgi:hypothetical protein